MTYSIGAEVSVVAYNGKSARSARCEALITGQVVKVTRLYFWVRSYEDGLIWKSPRWISTY